MRRQLRVGVTRALLQLEPYGGHGKVWSRTLSELARLAKLVSIDPPTSAVGRLRRGAKPHGSVDVVLADGHAALPERGDIPLVVQVHETGWHDPELEALLDPAFYAHIAPTTERALRTADQVITPSRSAARDVAVHYRLNPKRVHAVAHGVDAQFTPSAQGGRRMVQLSLARPSTAAADAPRYVLYAASLHPRKNLGALREAMSRLAVEGFPHVLAIAGMAAPDRADSSELIAEARAELAGAPGRVAYLGQVGDRDLAALMSEADAFCLPSLYEGFGLTALEAMACGTPVIVSDRGALPEVVGEAGVVSDPEPGALARALAELLDDPGKASALGAAGANRASSFTWRRTAEGWLAVLRLAASGS